MTLAADLSYRWNDPADIGPAAAFAGRIIGAAPQYISHGEIQTGLSDDGQTWVPDLADLYAKDFADPGERDMLVGRDDAGDVRAILIVAWEENPRRRYAVIEDMAVDPELRSHGVGKEMLLQAEARIRKRGVEWVFLESGRENEGAHGFFEREGFEKLSSVFGRKLG
ncbi:MAG: GNAT family N-acetyltransferase [Erythrobacter sp.]|nr:MAG: GNAT family N-acetyltransferase [Erythrobacter sp.]